LGLVGIDEKREIMIVDMKVWPEIPWWRYLLNQYRWKPPMDGRTYWTDEIPQPPYDL